MATIACNKKTANTASTMSRPSASRATPPTRHGRRAKGQMQGFRWGNKRSSSNPECVQGQDWISDVSFRLASFFLVGSWPAPWVDCATREWMIAVRLSFSACGRSERSASPSSGEARPGREDPRQLPSGRGRWSWRVPWRIPVDACAGRTSLLSRHTLRRSTPFPAPSALCGPPSRAFPRRLRPTPVRGAP